MREDSLREPSSITRRTTPANHNSLFQEVQDYIGKKKRFPVLEFKINFSKGGLSGEVTYCINSESIPPSLPPSLLGHLVLPVGLDLVEAALLALLLILLISHFCLFPFLHLTKE